MAKSIPIQDPKTGKFAGSIGVGKNRTPTPAPISVPKPVTTFSLPAHVNPKPPVGAWSEKDTILLRAIHGSRLYGLSHADSDEDFYVVTPTKKTLKAINASQTIQDKIDTTTVDFATFVRMAERGIPQALEAMFSQMSKSDFFEDYRQGYYASAPTVIHTYMRTIKSFSLSDTFKRRRHALRLAHNLNELLYTGRFNPTLSPKVAEEITRQANQDLKEYFRSLNKLSLVELDWDETDKTF